MVQWLRLRFWLLVQDCLVEGGALIPKKKATKLQLVAEQPWTGGRWIHQKRYPTPKDKEEATKRW